MTGDGSLERLADAIEELIRRLDTHPELSPRPTPVNVTDDRPWMDVAEVTVYGRAGRSEVLAALNDGSLRGHQNKPGGKWRIHRDDVDAWLRGEPALNDD